jgi:Spy/CpxP family protein refolding chaperone
VSALIALIVTIFTFILPASAIAERKGAGIHSKINLSPEQREKVQAHRRESREKTKRVTDDLRDARMDLFTQLREYKLDQRKLTDAVGQVNRLQESLLNAKLGNQIALRRLLTSDQFDKLRTAVKDMGVDREGTAGHSDGVELNGADIHELKLSKDQQERIKSLFERSRGNMKPLASQLRSTSQELHGLYMNYDLDQNKAKSLISKIADTRLRMLKSMVARQQQLRAILTEQQFQELSKAMRPPGEHRQRHGTKRDR